jgi:hypothetical protein
MTRAARQLLALALLGGGALAGAPPAAGAARPLGLEVLAELAYPGLLEDGAVAQLRAGRWRGAPQEPGLASRPTAVLVPYLIARGDLDRDGRDDAVVFLETSAGGSGAFLHLAAVLDRPDGPLPLPAHAIGDRAEVEALQVVAGQVVLDAVVAGPDDASCCPTSRVRRTYGIEDGALRELATWARGRLALRALAGTRWRLTRLDAATPVPAASRVELRLDEGRVSGTTGCNDFHGELLGDERDALEVGPLATTGRACPGPAGRLEQRFLAALDRAHRFGFFFGRLELQYDTREQRTGRLRFMPVAND